MSIYLYSQITHDFTQHRTTHTWTAPSTTTDCFIDGYNDGQRTQFWMSRLCCTNHTTMPCWCCWRPGACGLPVSSVDWQPVLPQKRRWLSDTSNATVLDRVGHWWVTVGVCRTSSNCHWQYPGIAWLVHIVGVCQMKAVHKVSALEWDRLACGLYGRPSGTVFAVRRLRCLWCRTSVKPRC